ncbi:MAG TPA: 50S ribosomal protein L25 [Candidatus Saccharimonadales bacterium]|nr:50S ribosomal protein L25 [Candidatus Saccharimonadales bacterium]
MELNTQTRQALGKKNKKLREERQIPAVIFAKGMDSLPLTVDLMQFGKVYKAAGTTTLVDLKVGDKSEKVLIKDVQYDPISLKPIHASFHKVNLKEKITAEIPVNIVGEENNELIKNGSALVLQLLNEISVEALPTDLPHEIVVDVSSLNDFERGITVAELKLDRSKVEIMGTEPDELVVKLGSAQMAEEPVEEVPVSEEEALAKITATEELSEEEKAARAAKEAEEKGKDKDKKD